MLADRLADLENITLITNSDAHSLEKIAREYSVLLLAEPSFSECVKAFRHIDGRAVIANYGLDPRLGKYHNTSCANCENSFINSRNHECSNCGSSKLVKGVADRIEEIADYIVPRHPNKRGKYYYQVPLGFLPGIGKKL